MTVTSIRVSNFRSIDEPVEVPLREPLTFLVGPNNEGKSTLLRALSLLFNKNGHESIQPHLDFQRGKEQRVHYRVEVTLDGLRKIGEGRANLNRYLQEAKSNSLILEIDIQKDKSDGGVIRQINSESLLAILPIRYLENHGREFLDDFGTAGDIPRNITELTGRYPWELHYPGTVYLPSIRFVTQPGTAIPHFGKFPMAGTVIEFSNIVTQLNEIFSPNGSPDYIFALNSQYSAICEFMCACLEADSVKFRVPSDRGTIFVTINGIEQPLSNLGSGVEQLLLIGLSSFAFPGKLVLLDEPELHFHPRTQKLMMQQLKRQHEGRMVVATHSAAMLDAIEADIVQVSISKGVCRTLLAESKQQKYLAIRNLGHSPSELVQSRFVIWVEGPSDRIYLNSWLKKIASELTEGIDYSILFYGGSVLAQHSFSDTENDLLKALSICRAFAVVMDSDRTKSDDELKARVQRVSKEAAEIGGLVWITAGREIENYVPKVTIQNYVKKRGNQVTIPTDEYEQILPPGSDKVGFAKTVVDDWGDAWPLDLKNKVSALASAILSAA